MRKLMSALVMLTASGTLSACVIGPGPVVSHGKAQAGDQRLNQNSAKDLARPDNPNDAVDLVDRYLNAAADNLENQLRTLRTYMRDKNWTPANKEINIYRVFEPEKGGQSDDTIPVTVPMQKIGVLKDGRLEPVNAGRAEVLFNVVDGPNGFLLKDAPSELMLSDEMLSDDGYEARPIYFWDNRGERLVPEIRYVAARQSEQEKAKQLVEYLYGGPSLWLDQAVKPPAGQVPLRTNPVYMSDAKMSLDLPNQLGEEELARLATQLERTLVKTGQVVGVEFKIQGVSVQPGRFQPIDDTKPGARFAVQQQKVVRLDSRSDRAASAVPLTEAVNTKVEWALFSRREESVALSQRDGNVQRFLIGPSAVPKQVTMPTGKPVDQAAWLEGGSRSALVLSDRKLYVVVPGAETPPTPLAGPLPGPVTSFSVVPDGRIALVIDKKFYMAALYHNGEVLSVTQPMQVPTALDQVLHVALMKVDAVIAGLSVEQSQPKLVVTVINVDGSRQQTWKDYGPSEQISRLVTDFRSGATAYYDYNGVAIQIGPGGAVPVRDVQVVRNEASPSPAPAASSTPAPAHPITAASFEG